MAYENLVGTLPYKRLFSTQLLEKLAANDAFDHFAAATVMVFFQAAAPTGWTKQTGNDDAALRVVSGTGGGTGGADGYAAHTHSTTSAGSHTHVMSGIGVWGVLNSADRLMNTTGNHTHSVSNDTKYINVISCSKA